MINARELRIGNYLFSHNNLVRVIEIKKDGFSVEPVGDYKTGWVKEFNIEPISLSPGRLMLCGFEKTYNKDSYKKKFDEYSRLSLIVSFGKEKIIVSILDEYTGEERLTVLTGTVVEFVHQVQNFFFALTGQELKIKELQHA